MKQAAEGLDIEFVTFGTVMIDIAKEMGLNVVGILTKDHAFCMLKDRRGNKDIETTIRYGFDPGTSGHSIQG